MDPFTANNLGKFQSTPPVKAATRRYSVPSFKMLFQSTPPVKAATGEAVFVSNKNGISIHAAREGGDALIYAV